MSKSDKKLVKRSMAVVADAAVQHIDQILGATPGHGLAYSLAKGLLGNAMQLRQQRVFEFMGAIIEHPKVFTKKYLNWKSFKTVLLMPCSST